MTIAQDLARFGCGADLDVVDDRIRGKLRAHTLDTLGCIVFSAGLEYAESVIEAIVLDEGPYGIPGTSASATLTDAALVAGTLSAGFELDDVGVFVHPGACVVPPAFLAAAYAQRVLGRATSGHELLAAILVGYEVTVRISEWVGFLPEDQIGWHTPAFHGAIGAAAAAARIWGLDDTQTTHAIASAADIAGGGLMQARFGSDIKRLHTGRAAQAGLLSASLAWRGVRGRVDVFEDPRWGYYRTIRYRGEAEPTESLRGEVVLDGLGTRFRSLDQVALKYFPCTAGAQSIIDNVAAACRELNIGPDDVADIEIQVSSWFFSQPETLQPAHGVEAVNFSYAYAAAMGAVHRPARLTDGGDPRLFVDSLRDSRVLRLQDQVRFVASRQIDDENRYSMDTVARVTAADGRIVTIRSHYGAKSSDESDGAIAFDAIDDAGVQRKFRALAGDSLASSTVDAAIATVKELENSADVVPLWSGLQHETKEP